MFFPTGGGPAQMRLQNPQISYGREEVLVFVAGRALWYPTQAKNGLNGAPNLCCRYIGTAALHPLPALAAKAGCPIQAVLWLEWDTQHSTWGAGAIARPAWSSKAESHG